MNSHIIQFFVNTSIAASLMLIPNMAKEFGSSNLEIGLVVGIYSFMAFLSHYVFGRASDIYGGRIFLRIGLLICGFTFLIQIFAKDYLSLFFLRALTGFSIGIFPAALIAYVYESGYGVGKFSSYGSLGWAFGSLIAGIIADYNGIFIVSSISFFLAFFASSKFKESKKELFEIPILPLKFIKKNFNIYFPFFLRHIGANMIWTIFPLYLVSLGADKFWIGIIYSINTGTQFLVMRKLDRFDYRKLIFIGVISSIVVFFLYALATSYLQIIPIQLLLGIAWSCLYVGSVTCLVKKNVEKATAVGILSSVLSLSAILGPLLGGIVTYIYGYHAVMYLASILTLIGLIATSNLRSKLK